MEKQMRISRGFIWLLQGFMGLGLLVGAAAVGVIAFRTVVERRKQIGMLRAIGYQRNTISLSFILESSFITIMGVISGVVLALVLAFLILNTPETKSTGMDVFVIPWWQIILIIVFAYGSSLLMSFIPSRRAASLTIAEALRYE
jgi:putative ABC transport system permease protein